jgi:PEP-CTERM motif-containing protein
MVTGIGDGRARSAKGMSMVGQRRLTFLSFCIATVVLCFALSRQAQAITINFSNLDHTSVTFAGGAFSFSSTNGYQFSITTVNGGVGDSIGLDGYVSPGGPFTIGTITISGPIQTAPVTGTGTLHITDAQNKDLTGSIQWDDITTFGVGGILDLTGTINLTGITYPGTNSDLGTLAAAGSASDVVTFQFVPAQTLTQLKNTGGSTSYSGSIAVVPEPGSVTLVGLGLLGLLAFCRRRK